MKPFDQAPADALGQVLYVLTDVDGTLTADDLLPAETLAALYRLRESGIEVVPVTAAPAGWCDGIARMWPVAAVIAENGGLSLRFDRQQKAMRRDYFDPEPVRAATWRRLHEVAEGILGEMPGVRLADDQRYRETSLAFDRPADPATAGALQERLVDAGVSTTANSLWVLGWIGEYDKLAMARRLTRDLWALDDDGLRVLVLYVGDSENDDAMFGFFPHAAGVSTVVDHLPHMRNRPAWITRGAGGHGFAEVAAALVASRRTARPRR